MSRGVLRQLLLCSLCAGALQQAHASSIGQKDRSPPKTPAPITSNECVGLLCDLTPGSMARPITAADAAAIRLAGMEKIGASHSVRRPKLRRTASNARRAHLATSAKSPAIMTLVTPSTPAENADEVLKQMSSNSDQPLRLVQIGLSGYSTVDRSMEGNLGERVRVFFAENQTDLKFTRVH